MKISDLIKNLEQVKQENGDLECWIQENDFNNDLQCLSCQRTDLVAPITLRSKDRKTILGCTGFAY